MDSSVVCAIISFCGVLVSVLSSMTLVNWRLQQLEKKVDEHNSWGNKFAQQEKDIAVIRTDVTYIKEAIQDLKERKI